MIMLEGELQVPCSLGEEVGKPEEALKPGNDLRRVCFGKLDIVPFPGKLGETRVWNWNCFRGCGR